MNQTVVPDGKGAKDRVTILPAVAKESLTQHLQSVKRRHQADLSRGAGWVDLPWALDRGPAGVTSPADRVLDP